MSSKPLVSIVMPFLNAEQFIEEAIESVFAQTYSNWELLLVDDGSNDDSAAIARRYAEEIREHVCALEHKDHKNRGMSASRNLGIRHAQGEYIAFLDADDVWLPHKLEQQVAILISQPDAAMVYGLSQWWYSWTGNAETSGRDFVHEPGVLPNTLLNPPVLFTAFFLRQSAAIPNPSNILVRREIIEQVSGFEEVFQGLYEDQAFYAKVCLKAPVFASSECWDRYRQHPNSSSAVVARRGQDYCARLFFLKWLVGYLSEHGMKNSELTQALQRQRWQYRFPILHRIFEEKQGLARKMHSLLMRTARRTLPLLFRRWLWAKWTGTDYCPPVGWVRFGSLRRLTPLSREFGYERGQPIDRYYIEQFLSAHSAEIRGHVLEIEDDIYVRQFGGERVTKCDVLHVRDGEPKATIVADLTRADNLPCETFDCIILTQTLQFIYDVHAAITTVYRVLKPGGVVLATVPGISPLSRYDMERWGQYWSFTTQSIQRLFEEVFPSANVTVEAHGNVLTATCFLHGLAVQELHQKELDYADPDYEVIITIRAVKPEEVIIQSKLIPEPDGA